MRLSQLFRPHRNSNEAANIPFEVQQTSPRLVYTYPIINLNAGHPKEPEVRLGVWLMRTAGVEEAWRGLRGEAKIGENPSIISFRGMQHALGFSPKYTSTMGRIDPGDDFPGIHQTTYLCAAAGNLAIPKPAPGLELTAFPIDELPVDQLRPEERDWLPGLLADEVAGGMKFPMEYRPEREGR